MCFEEQMKSSKEQSRAVQMEGTIRTTVWGAVCSIRGAVGCLLIKRCGVLGGGELRGVPNRAYDFFIFGGEGCYHVACGILVP